MAVVKISVLSLGRWLSADTIVPSLANPQSLNRYSWVLGNPLRYVDPTGHQEEPWWEKTRKWFVRTVNQIRDSVREWWFYHNPCSMSVDPMCNPFNAFSVSPPQPSPPQQVLLIGGEELERLRQVGRWVDKAESMSAAARAYQRFISGGSDDRVFEVEGVTFDGFDETRGILLEAKNIPENFVDSTTGQFDTWVTGTDDWLKQAENQIKVAGGVPIEWHFSTEALRDAMYYLFHEQNPDLLKYIELVYTPMPEE